MRNNYVAAMQLVAIDHIINTAQNELSELMQRPVKIRIQVGTPTNDLRWRYLRETIEDVSGYDWSRIASRSQERRFVLLRFAYCYIGCTMIGGRSLKAMAADIGKHEHTSVINARDSFKDLLETKEPDATGLYNAILEKMKPDEIKIETLGGASDNADAGRLPTQLTPPQLRRSPFGSYDGQVMAGFNKANNTS